MKKIGIWIIAGIIIMAVLAIMLLGAGVIKRSPEQVVTQTPTPTPLTATATPTPLLDKILTAEALVASYQHLRLEDTVTVSGVVNEIVSGDGYYLSAGNNKVKIEIGTNQFNTVKVGDRITVKGEISSSNSFMVVIRRAKLISRDPS